ncbi:bifunctional DNA primase/polymerase [Streptomyces tauricus]
MTNTPIETRDFPKQQAASMVPAKGPFADSWEQYREAGWLGTLKLPKLSKKPVPAGFTGDHGEFPTDDQCALWALTSNANIGLRMPGNVIGIDVDDYDDKHGAEQLAILEERWGLLPPTWVTTGRGFGPSGKRMYRVPDGKQWPTQIADDIECLQYRHRYAAVWPSVVADKHDPTKTRTERWYAPDGRMSDRVPTVDELPELPGSWVTGLLTLSRGSKSAPNASDFPAKVKFPASAEDCTDWFDHMLLDRGSPGRGNQNSLSVVGGAVQSCIKHGLPFKLALAIALNYEGASGDPQDRAVIYDQAARMWADEVAKQRDDLTEKFAEASGFLEPREEGIGYVTLSDNRFGKAEEMPFGDFKVLATSVHTQDGRTVWTLDLTHKSGKVFEDVEMTHEVLSSTQALRRWLQGYRCSLFFANDRDQRGTAGTRLQALLESQNPVDCRVVSYLGWDDKAGVFVTFEGAITADGIDTRANVRPSRDLVARGLISHVYGFRPEQETREVLREVLTFHDETVTSVVFSWLCAAVLKGHLKRQSSQFPILVVEAPSESGKSTGFSSMAYQLLGSKLAEAGDSTPAVLRDSMTAHRGAPVRIDDMDSIAPLLANLRQVTVEGYSDKMGEDRRSTVRNKLVAPVWLSGEGVTAVHEEKAIKDRSVLLRMPNPKGRVSLKDPMRPQWDDIQDLMARYPDGLSVMAGTLVQMVLRHAGRVDEFKELRGASGRHADKMAILRVGARVLADVTQDEAHAKRVDEWVSDQIDTGAENAMTLKVIPAAVKVLGVPSKPVEIDHAPHFGIASPIVFREAPGQADHAMWVNITNLAEWWKKYNNGKVAERTETGEAMAGQANQLGMKGRRAGERNVDWAQFNVSKATPDGTVKKVLYQRVPDDNAARVLESLGVEIGADEEHNPGKLNAAQIAAIDRA